MSVNQRIEELYNFQKFSQSEFSKVVGVPQSRLNNQVLGKNGVGLDTIVSIVETFKDLNARWLLTGEGEMFLSENWNNQNTEHELSTVSEPPALEYGISKVFEPLVGNTEGGFCSMSADGSCLFKGLAERSELKKEVSELKRENISLKRKLNKVK